MSSASSTGFPASSAGDSGGGARGWGGGAGFTNARRPRTSEKKKEKAWAFPLRRILFSWQIFYVLALSEEEKKEKEKKEKEKKA